MSSAEKLTFVIGRWLRPMIVLLHVVRQLGLLSISRREQECTALNH
jgi:hypothetical protein